MTELSRLLAVAGPALILVGAVAGLVGRWGHSLIRPAMWFAVPVAGFFTIYRAVLVFYNEPVRGSWQFDFIIVMNNVAVFVLSLVVLVFLFGAWKWRDLGMPHDVTRIKRRGG